MRRTKLAAALIWPLLLAFITGGADIAGGRGAGAQAEGTQLLAISVPAPAAVPAPALEPIQAAEPEPSPEAANAPAPDTAPAPEPEPGPETEMLTLPAIPHDAPAPAQIKKLPASDMVCLTFDDGYSEASIIKILGCLREYDVRCTFFIIGSCLKLYPELWRRAAEDGHEIAYHTMNHRSLNRCSNAQIVRDINRWNETVRSVLGVGYRIPRIARAPGGSANARVRRLLNCLGYRLIYWSSDTFTGVYRRSHANAAERVSSYILRHAAAGAISLQHFNRYDAASVPRYIAALKARFRLGTVSEALLIADAKAERERMKTLMKSGAQSADSSGKG